MGWVNVIKLRTCGKRKISRGVAVLFLLAWGNMANAVSNDVTVSTDITEGTCAVSITYMGAPAAALSLGNIESSQLTAVGAMAGFKPVVLTLSTCGLAGANKAPFVDLDSSSFAQAADVPGANNYMFRNQGVAGGDSHGYFIFVANTNAQRWSPVATSGVGDGVYGRALPIPMAVAGAAEGAEKTVYLGVGCGSNCTSPATYGGSVRASLVFSFLYK